jgi:hypothetical protein
MTQPPKARVKDPTQLPVQMSVKVPWDFREFLYEVADAKETSISNLVRDDLLEKYGAAFARKQTR